MNNLESTEEELTEGRKKIIGKKKREYQPSIKGLSSKGMRKLKVSGKPHKIVGPGNRRPRIPLFRAN